MLHRVAFKGEDFAHWAILLPAKTGAPIGTFVHIGVQKDKRTKKPIHHELLIDTIDLTTSTVQESRPILGSNVSEAQLIEAARAVFNRDGNTYHMLTNNCQHFCIDVVTWLHQHYPNAVTKESVKDCEGKGTTAVAVRKFILWTRFTKEGREAYLKAKQAKAAQAAAATAAARPASQRSNQPRLSIN